MISISSVYASDTSVKLINGCLTEMCCSLCDEVNNVSLCDGHEFEPLPLKTRESFTLYKEWNTSHPITKFEAGTFVIPLDQKIVIEDRGEYVLGRKLDGIPFKVGDKFNSPMLEGEENFRFQHNGVWVRNYSPYNKNQAILGDCFFLGKCEGIREVRKKQIRDWLMIEVNGVVGYTPNFILYSCGG